MTIQRALDLDELDHLTGGRFGPNDIPTVFFISKSDDMAELVKQLYLIRQNINAAVPGAGLMVMSAWCLGVLNSHHRFLVSYAAPVVWNAAMITTLVLFGAGRPLPQLARILAWGSVIGSGLMFVVQLPIVVRLAPDSADARTTRALPRVSLR